MVSTWVNIFYGTAPVACDMKKVICASIYQFFSISSLLPLIGYFSQKCLKKLLIDLQRLYKINIFCES